MSEAQGDVCIANIGPKGIRRRYRFGAINFGIGVVLAAVLLAVAVPWWARLVVLLPFLSGALGYFQASEKT